MNSPKGSSLVKKQMRDLLTQTLLGFPFGELIEKSSRLSAGFFDFILRQTGLISGQFIVSFCPFGNEPQINIEREARDEPYQVGYVRVDDWNSRKMTPRVCRRDTPDLWEEIEVGGGNRIFQPTAALSLIPPDKIGIVLVPGIGFSPEGGRLGRGAGFYDRFLKSVPEALRVGVAFQEQVVTGLPEDPWDERVDAILTDQKWIPMNSYGDWANHGKIKNRKHR